MEAFTARSTGTRQHGTWRHTYLEEHSNGIASLRLTKAAQQAKHFASQVMPELCRRVEILSARPDIRFLLLESETRNVFFETTVAQSIFDFGDTVEDADPICTRIQQMLSMFEQLPFPTMALVNGTCSGIGAELALACTYRIATDNPAVQFGLPESRYGLVPPGGAHWRLPRIVGAWHATSLLTSGEHISAGRAQHIGLVDRVWPQPYHRQWAYRAAEDSATGNETEGIRPPVSPPSGVDRTSALTMILSATVHRLAGRKRSLVSPNSSPSFQEADRLMQNGVRVNQRTALDIARSTFARLAGTPTARNLTSLHAARVKAQKSSTSGIKGRPKQLTRPLIVGSTGTAKALEHLFRQSGIMSKTIHKLSDSRSEVERADVVIEATEDTLNGRRELLSSIEGYTTPATVILSMSGITPVSRLGRDLERPRRFLGISVFMPPEPVRPIFPEPLIQIIPGMETSAATVASIAGLVRRIAAIPMRVKDSSAFLVNRLKTSYLREVLQLTNEGHKYHNVDRELLSFGMQYSPFDQINTLAADEADYLRNAGGLTNSLPEKTASGAPHGVKRNSRLRAIRNTTSLPDVALRPVFAMLNEAAGVLDEVVVETASEVDLASTLGVAFPPHRGGILRYADDLGIRQARDTLSAYADRYGERFRPADCIQQLAGENRRFHEAYATP